MNRYLFSAAMVVGAASIFASCATASEIKNCGSLELCGQLCISLPSDPENCGACGVTCSGTEACVTGKCTSRCPGAETLCADAKGHMSCVNFTSDNANCGACGKSCKAPEACSRGVCTSPCSGKTLCTSDGGVVYCADPKSDNANCGGCGKSCKSTEACIGGSCVSSCAADQTLCPAGDGGPAYCAHLQSDNVNCGTCGQPCGKLESCLGGACTSQCAAPQQLCTPEAGAAYCADTITDNANCGGCGVTCPPSKPVCSGATCTSGAKISALVCGAATQSWIVDAQTKLLATNAFTLVDVINCGNSTPTLAQLQSYQSVLVFSDSGFQNAATLGDNLADYVAGGGYAVVAVFANASVPVGGKWSSQGYNLITPSGQDQPTESAALKILDLSSPLVAGVSTLTATAGYKSTGSATNGGVVVAQWGGGAPLIVRGVKNNRNRAEVNFYPPSSGVRNDFWVGDGTTILKNALVYR